MTYREPNKLLKQDGWFIAATKGSHVHYLHPAKKGKVTVPKHAGDIKPGTLKSIYRQAGL